MTGNTISPQFTICALLEVFRTMKKYLLAPPLKLINFYEYNIPSAGLGYEFKTSLKNRFINAFDFEQINKRN